MAKPFLELATLSDGKVYAKKAHPKVAVIIPITKEGKFVLTEQAREAMAALVVEFPAGHIGDVEGSEAEDILAASQRELIEETGYKAGKLELVGAGASTPGMTDEINYFVLAMELEKVGEGGGVDDEDIIIHEVKVDEVMGWLALQNRRGRIISAKTYAGILFANRCHHFVVKGFVNGFANNVITTSDFALAKEAALAAISSGEWVQVSINEVFSPPDTVV